jgi:hypothetical protein
MKKVQIGNKLLQNVESRREFLDKLGKKLNFQKPEDWYGLKKRDLPGSSLILSLYGSIAELFKQTYPEHEWNTWQFTGALKNGYWGDKKNQKDFMKWLGKQLGFKTMEDWYNITRKDIMDNGGATLLLKHRGSPSKLVTSVYSDHEWMIWKFQRVAKGTWTNLEQSQRIEMIMWVEKELRIETMEDWYRISWSQIDSKIPVEFFKQYPLEQVLKEAYPDYIWDMTKLQSRHIKADLK